MTLNREAMTKVAPAVNLYNTLMGRYVNDFPYPLKKHQMRLIEEGDLFWEMEDWVYLIYNKYNNLCKIGRTGNLHARMLSLRATSGISLQLLVAINLEAGYDEKSELIEELLHDHFKSKRELGEWFSLSVREIISIRLLFYAIEGIDMRDSVKEVLSDN